MKPSKSNQKGFSGIPRASPGIPIPIANPAGEMSEFSRSFYNGPDENGTHIMF